MSTPLSPPRDQRPSARRWHWKDAVIALLSILLLAVSSFAFKDRLAAAGSWFRSPGPAGEKVAVFQVNVDHQHRAWVDVLFDRPLGQGK